MFENVIRWITERNKSNRRFKKEHAQALFAYRVKRNGPTSKYFKPTKMKKIPTFASTKPIRKENGYYVEYWDDPSNFKRGLPKPKRGYTVPSSRWW